MKMIQIREIWGERGNGQGYGEMFTANKKKT